MGKSPCGDSPVCLCYFLPNPRDYCIGNDQYDSWKSWLAAHWICCPRSATAKICSTSTTCGNKCGTGWGGGGVGNRIGGVQVSLTGRFQWHSVCWRKKMLRILLALPFLLALSACGMSGGVCLLCGYGARTVTTTVAVQYAHPAPPVSEERMREDVDSYYGGHTPDNVLVSTGHQGLGSLLPDGCHWTTEPFGMPNGEARKFECP